MGNTALAKGNASISINDQETEARLLFAPDPEGYGWDAAAINKLASEHQLGAHPDPKALETFLSKAARAKSKETMEMMFARGIDPEPPVGEKINWEALPIPGEMAPFKEEALAKAGPPRIFHVKVEKVKHEQKVQKPGALPFMSGKEEIAVTWEKRETREEVDVNPKVLQVKYADRGKKIGAIIPPVPGKPGKNIFGRLVHPLEAAGESCFLGDGIAKGKEEVSSQVSGFLRIGENWADMVPFAKHVFNINTGIDGLTLFFNFEPGDPRFAVPMGEEILAAAIEKGAPEESLINAEEIDQAIAESLKTGEPVIALTLFHAQEAESRVDINDDKTRATLFLRKGVAGARPLVMKAISQAIKESGIHGIDTERLKADIHAFMQGKDLVLSDYVLVEGFPSSRGMDRELELKVALISKEEQALILDRLKEWYKITVPENTGLVPNEAMSFAFVEKDAVVASISPGSDGEEGKDIFGNVVPGLPGNDPDIKLYKGLVLHGSEINASQDGLLLLEASENSFHAEVIDYKDAKIEVHLSGDDMKATVDLFRERGAGIPLSLENVKKALAGSEVVKGIHWEALEKACIQARSHGRVMGHLIAKGEKAIARGGSVVKWRVPIERPKLAALDSSIETEESESVVIQIKAGIPIVEISEALPDGRSGYNVKGTELSIDEAEAITIEHDNSIKVVPLKNGRRLVAGSSGELSFDGRQLKIESSRNISGDASGKIKFSGEIKIAGKVLPGTAIFGGSHVTIGGFAEEALVSAEGRATVMKGFKGGGKGVIRAKTDIVTAFVERATVMAVGNIKLNRGSIQSTIKTNGKLTVSAEGGKISGGVCQARHGVDAVDIGSEKCPRTEISFGQDYLVKDQIIACEEEASRAKAALSKTEEKIQGCLDNKLALSDDLTKEKVRLVKILEHLNMKLFTLREKFEEHFDSEIRIRGTVFPGVVIESHGRYYEVNQKRSAVVIYFDRDSGRIIEKQLDGV
ncbi:MAG: FapA family protein [Treponema sp.]|nr:FapA family protein [Treponema sp.]